MSFVEVSFPRDLQGLFTEIFGQPHLACRTSSSLLDNSAMQQQEDGQYTATVDLPGVDLANISLTCQDGVVSVQVEHKNGSTTKRTRSFWLPEDADVENITAQYHNGRLTIKVPKIPAKQPRKIEIAAL